MVEDEGVEVKEEEEYCWNDGRVLTEDDGDNRTKPISLIYQESGYQSSPLSSNGSLRTPICPSTLNPDDPM